MDKNTLYKKGISFIISFLFIGTIIFPSSGIRVTEEHPIVSFEGNILYVGGDGPGNYSTVQEAIDNATDGDTIYVYNGIYDGFTVNKRLTITGEDTNNTIIDGKDAGIVIIIIIAPRVSLSRFTIRNSGCRSDNAGIDVFSSHNTIFRNNITKNLYGVNLESQGYNNTISENYFNKNGQGIIVHSSNNNLIYKNLISDNNIGIQTVRSSGHNIYENRFENNSMAFHITDSSKQKIFKNIFIGNRVGLKIWGLSNIIKDNIFVSSGISFNIDFIMNKNALPYWNTHTIENNTIDGRPIRYYKNESNIVIPKNTGQIILTNCTNTTIKNFNFVDKGTGIQLGFSSNNKIFDNIIANNLEVGILLAISDNNYVTRNIIENNGFGIGLHVSSNNTIFSNTLNNNSAGIFLIEDVGNIIYENNFTNNFDGITLALFNENNTIYHNNFINSPVFFIFEGSDIWDNGYPSGGNYWSDYNGIDAFSGANQDEPGFDGIGDKPYVFHNDMGEDRYPLMYPYGMVDKECPEIEIDKPERGIYIANRRIMRLPLRTIILGKIRIEVTSADNKSGVAKVDFFIDGELKSTDYSKPYRFIWKRDKRRLLRHRYTIKVVAYDYFGNTVSQEMIVKRFF